MSECPHYGKIDTDSVEESGPWGTHQSGRLVGLPPILDACCGSRMMWFDHNHPDALYVDHRCETITVPDRSHGKVDGTRTVEIAPDEVVDFRDMPYPDKSFRLVVFDPPHLVSAGPKNNKALNA